MVWPCFKHEQRQNSKASFEHVTKTKTKNKPKKKERENA